MSIVSLQKIASHFSGIAELLTRVDLHAIEAVARAIRETQAAQRTVFTFGNGGSPATAFRFANNLLSPKHGARRRVNCLMSNVSVISALANDIGYELIYSEQLRMLEIGRASCRERVQI